MSTIIRLLDLVTSDTLTLVAACVLALAILGLLLVISWPADDTRSVGTSSRSSTARSLAAAGTPHLEIARQTGLSRDALALMIAASRRTSRQLSPDPVPFSLLHPFRRLAAQRAHRAQLHA